MRLKFKKWHIFLFTALVIGLIIGWFAGAVYGPNPPPPPPPPVVVREDSSAFQFINPLIFSKTSKSFYADEYKNLNSSLTSYIDTATRAGTAKNISVYFRDLNSGSWMGVNEDDTYNPASMLKVVVMAATLKLALQDPGILSQALPYQGPMDQDQYFKPNDNLSVGPQSVQTLIDTMIVDSDNGAVAALLGNKEIQLAVQDTSQTFSLPSLESPTTTPDYMSPRSYSVAFRTLYDSTYLTWSLSNQALQLLTQTTFTQGLVAGVPTGTVVAHKFGEYGELLPNGTTQDLELHDCGIVYYPGYPYFICVMTRGKDYPDLETVIQNISKLVYHYVDTTKE
jgi:beta-lactamase class A